MVMNDKQTPMRIRSRDLPLAKPSGPEVLKAERAKASFDVNELAAYIYGQGSSIVLDDASSGIDRLQNISTDKLRS